MLVFLTSKNRGECVSWSNEPLTDAVPYLARMAALHVQDCTCTVTELRSCFPNQAINTSELSLF
jgi:hypothetical protein